MCIVDTYILEYDGLVYVELYTMYILESNFSVLAFRLMDD